MTFSRSSRLLVLTLTLRLFSTAAITFALWKVLMMLFSEVTQGMTEADPDPPDNQTSNQLLLKMLNSNGPMEDPPEPKELSQKLLQDAQVTLATLLLALISNLVTVGMALQQLCELPGDADVASKDGLQLSARPLTMPEAQRDSSQSSLALEMPHGDPQLRRQGGVMAAGDNDPEQQGARGGGEARGRNGGRDGGGGGTLRRSETCDDLALMPLDCTQAQGHRAIDWTSVARLTPRPDQNVDLLRFRSRNQQCKPGLHQDQYTKRQS